MKNCYTKRYINIYNPHYTGKERRILCQRGMYFDKKDALKHQSDERISDLAVEVLINLNKKVQDDIIPNEGFEVKYLNIFTTSNKDISSAQSGLYDSRDESITVANKWENHSHNKGLEQYIYDAIAVPVILKKVDIDFSNLTPKASFNFDVVFCEELCFGITDNA